MAPRGARRGNGCHRHAVAWLLVALLAGCEVREAAAAVGLKLPIIPWFSALRGGYVDLITRQPITTSYTLASAQPQPPAQEGVFQAQNNLFNQAPRPTSRTMFPVTLPSLDFWEKCFKETDTLSALVTKCNYQDTYTTCSQLAELGYLPKGVQAFQAPQLTGAFNLPTGCTAGSLGVSYDKLFRLTFNSPQVPILAVITKDAVGSMVSYFGTGSTQGRVKHRLATKAEFCYAPTMSEISVSKTAVYSTGMQPGTAAWMFSKSVALPPAYTNNRAVMFNGDSVDATWTLTARKSGTDVNYQGVVSGTISINNPTPAAITVTSIIDQVTGGPAATVACPVGTPFTVPACSFATCQYTAYYPTSPPPGTYSTAAQVQFQVQGSQGYPAAVQGTSVFNVGNVAQLSSLATSAGTIPTGAALVTDPGSTQGSFMFSGPGSQTYTTNLACDGGASASGAVSNTATLTGSNGQQISQSATVQKQCYDLFVSVATKSSPVVGRWGWSVSKTATPRTLSLRPDQKALNAAGAAAGNSPLTFGRDYASTTTGDVVYSVTFTRTPPSGFVAGVPAFEAAGEAYVQNPAPINARLQGVYVSISNSRGGQPYVVAASCPVLIVPAGQRITCTWRATPSFNPVGEQVRASARYINTRNGDPLGSTTDFNSPSATIGGGLNGTDADGSSTRRRLQQTWGGHAAGRAPSVGVVPELAPPLVSSMFAVDGRPIIVPTSVANGTGVIVSGNAVVSGGSPSGAMSAAGGVPVILPSQPPTGGAANNGAFVVNEAGPAFGAALAEAAASSLTGLEDECVDVADAFTVGEGSVQGKLVSGTPASGRICSTTSFTYTVRYGPFGDCAPRKSVNAATFQTVDTQERGTSQAEVAIKVEGCGNPSALKISPVQMTTSARGGYAWAVTKRADQSEVVVGQDGTATVTYTVDYQRSGAKAGATVTADVAVTNPTGYPVEIEAATYTATTLCDGQAKTSSGPVTCDAGSVPARGKLTCRVAASVPCAGNGAYTVVLTAGGGFSVTTAPTPFAFNAQALSAANLNSQCATVSDAFLTGSGRVNGVVVSGARPSGQICFSETFTYTVKFGPFPKCGTFKAVNRASAVSGGLTPNATATSTVPISVIGCSVYTELARAADCVRPASYWPSCDLDLDAKCANGWKLLPGGAGKGTLFFPKPNERATRTYSGMLSSAAAADATAAKKAYLSAGRQFVTAQLNFLSGARLPTVDLQDAFDSLSSLLSTTGEGSPMSVAQVKAIQVQADLLAKYNNGTLPATYKAPQRCT